MFASAITPGGVKNYTNTLIKPDMKVYALKGQPGSGVKEMAARAAQTAWEMELFTEQFHCPFEPDFIDMVIIPDINSIIINTSQPFHYDISMLEGINIVKTIDLDICIYTDILNQYTTEIEDAKTRFYSLIDKAISHIARAKAMHDTIENYYVPAMDFEKVQTKRQEDRKSVVLGKSVDLSGGRII